MYMQWTDVIQNVLVPIGAFLGGGWILNFYNAKPKKNSIEIDNMKKAMDELQDVIKQMSDSSKSYREETNKTIKELKDEMAEMKIRLDIKHEAIYASERCDKIEDTNECIVMSTFKKKCKDCLNK